MLSNPNAIQSVMVERDKAARAEDLAISITHAKRDAVLRQVRGQLSDKRFIERANKEVWQ